jgi:DNA polymerase V
VTVFLATNRHRLDLAQYTADDTIRLSTPTDDTTIIIQVVKQILEKIFRERYHYKQAGVILGKLQSAEGAQLDLFASNQVEETARQKRLMRAIDTINGRFGKNQIHFAIQGLENDTEDVPAGFMRPHNIE